MGRGERKRKKLPPTSSVRVRGIAVPKIEVDVGLAYALGERPERADSAADGFPDALALLQSSFLAVVFAETGYDGQSPSVLGVIVEDVACAGRRRLFGRRQGGLERVVGLRWLEELDVRFLHCDSGGIRERERWPADSGDTRDNHGSASHNTPSL